MLKIYERIASIDIFTFYLRHLPTAVDNSEILQKNETLKMPINFFSRKVDHFVLTIIIVK